MCPGFSEVPGGSDFARGSQWARTCGQEFTGPTCHRLARMAELKPMKGVVFGLVGSGPSARANHAA